MAADRIRNIRRQPRRLPDEDEYYSSREDKSASRPVTREAKERDMGKQSGSGGQRRTTRRPAPRRTSRAPSRSGSSSPQKKPQIANPVIGITCSYRHFPKHDDHECEYFYVYEPYINAIVKAGGIPVIIPVGIEGRYASRVFNLLNGLLLTGGGDIDPNRYSDLLSPKLRMVDPKKDQTEIDLFNLAFNANMPVLGICRGAQLMNVALDGTLYQDITSQVRMAINHDPEFPPKEPSHPVDIISDSRLYKAIGEKTIWVNSWHHQGIKLHGKGLIATAKAPDGLVETIEHPSKKWIVGVQWHPEMMWEQDKLQAKLFKAFVDASKG